MGESSYVQRARSTALTIAGAYLVVSSAWIVFSDRLVALLAPEQIAGAQSIKGLAFVGVSSLTVFLLTRGYLGRALAHEAEARNEAERSQALLAASPGAVLAIDDELRITAVNPAAEGLLGIDAAGLVGRLASEFVSGRTGAAIEAAARRAAAGERVESVEGLVCIRGGRRLWASAWAAPLSASGGAVFVVLDRTREWRYERKARRRSRQLLDLEHRLAEALEDERREIAEGLHDGLGQTLAAAKMNLELIGAGIEDAADRTAATAALIDVALSTSRTFAYALYPPPLEESGLMAAVEWLAARKNRTDTTEWTVSGHVKFDDSVLGAVLYRAIAELAQNVTSHANAAKAHIALTNVPGGIEIRVADDGRGFSGEPSSFGLGLRAVSARVARLSGTMRVESAPGHTEVVLNVPLTTAATSGAQC